MEEEEEAFYFALFFVKSKIKEGDNFLESSS